jgi:replicative DNA helicase
MTVLHNTEAEATVLAAMLRYPDSYWGINDVGLTSRDFLGVTNIKVMAAIEKVTGDRKQPDLSLVTEQLSTNEDARAYVSKLLSVPATVGQAIEAAKVVKGLATSRMLQAVGARIIGIADEHRSDSESAVMDAESLLRGVRNELPQPDRSPDPSDIIARINRPADDKSIRIRFSPALDAKIGGLHPGHLWVIGGFSSTGKSAAVCNMVYDVIKAKKWAGVFSLEMTQEQYLIRMESIATGVSQHDIKNRTFFGHEAVDRMRRAEAYFSAAPMRVYDTSYRLQDIRSKAIRQKEVTGLDVMVVDFIQNVYVTGDEISDARATILELQNMAKELDCTVIALSQVSNEYAKMDANSNFYSFKGHGAIRDAADVGVMLRRDRRNNPGVMDFEVVKHRHGEFGNIPMYFDLRTGKLSDAIDLTPDTED